MWRATMQDASLGTVHLLRSAERPRRLILFVSGDGGWNDDAADVAARLVATDALVAGVDIRDWRSVAERSSASCVNFSSTLLQLATRLHDELRTPRAPVVLAGHSAGATVAYLALSQAPPKRFAGAISMGFAPVLEFPKAPCSASPFAVARESWSEFRITSTGPLSEPWWVLQGTDDTVTPPDEAQPFASRVGTAHYVALTGQGHDFAGHDSWMRAAEDALQALAPVGHDRRQVRRGEAP